jgi:hypothetical protein
MFIFIRTVDNNVLRSIYICIYIYISIYINIHIYTLQLQGMLKTNIYTQICIYIYKDVYLNINLFIQAHMNCIKKYGSYQRLLSIYQGLWDGI